MEWRRARPDDCDAQVLGPKEMKRDLVGPVGEVVQEGEPVGGLMRHGGMERVAPHKNSPVIDYLDAAREQLGANRDPSSSIVLLAIFRPVEQRVPRPLDRLGRAQPGGERERHADRPEGDQEPRQHDLAGELG